MLSSHATERDYTRESSWTKNMCGFSLSLKVCMVMHCIVQPAWRSCLTTMCMDKDLAQYRAKQQVRTMLNVSQQVTHRDLILFSCSRQARESVIGSMSCFE